MTLLDRITRLARRPPGYVLARLRREARMEADRFLGPLFQRTLTGEKLARLSSHGTVDALWAELATRPHPLETHRMDAARLEQLVPGMASIVRGRAEHALRHEIDLLGSGPVSLGEHIDWHRDFVTGDYWPVEFCRGIDYVNRGRPSDVKRPWELSRLQWLLPAAQAFQFDGDERYAAGARDVLEQWIDANPYAQGVNWSCTMEAALRILSWTYLFHVFAGSAAWADGVFRSKFMASLYAHGAFTSVHIERSSINGNHLTSDAVGLVFAGLFFRGIGDADRWASDGWSELTAEIERQVHRDGVDFEASVPYHRLVAELFLLAARYRQVCGLPVVNSYADRLRAMARFTVAYTRPDGSSPHWGDADDGRALPLGTQSLDDHRYITGLVGLALGDAELLAGDWGDGGEVAWHFGMDASDRSNGTAAAQSAAFPDGGVYVLRSGNNHVFIDCGPVGLAGLGGHGHNDTLSFEAMLGGVALIADPGSFVYTASFEERNLFRSTASHNTPQVDDEDVNRLHSPDNLWNMHDDARAECLVFEPGVELDRFIGTHRGYRRLPSPVAVVREITLDHRTSRLTFTDDLAGEGRHAVSIPLHLAHTVEVTLTELGCELTSGDKRFMLTWEGSSGWTLSLEESRVSPSYGVALPAKRLVWRVSAPLPLRLSVTIAPAETGP